MGKFTSGDGGKNAGVLEEIRASSKTGKTGPGEQPAERGTEVGASRMEKIEPLAAEALLAYPKLTAACQAVLESRASVASN